MERQLCCTSKLTTCRSQIHEPSYLLSLSKHQSQIFHSNLKAKLCMLGTQWLKLGHYGTFLNTNDGKSKIDVKSSSSLAFWDTTSKKNSNCFASRGKNSLWLSQELPRLLSMQKMPGDGLALTRGEWYWETGDPGHYQLQGLMKFYNVTSHKEIFIPEVSAKVVLLSEDDLSGITTDVKIIPKHPPSGCKLKAPRSDGYWEAYITRAGEGTSMEVIVDVRSDLGEGRLKKLKAARVDISYWSYGPHGRSRHSQHVILPLQFPEPGSEEPKWKALGDGVQVLAIPTHLLCHLDDPLAVVKRYVSLHALPGDVVCLGETPLAIMQGRFRHPSGVRAGRTAQFACAFFHPTSSLATKCGMQALIDVVGRLRVIFAVIGAIVARMFGKRGMFYVLAGEQARLIDDVTGTLPPYDQFITLGPLRVKETVDALKAKLGIESAVVDVNDLKRVQILGSSDGVSESALAAALVNNPAGNADEQTPLVLVRGLPVKNEA